MDVPIAQFLTTGFILSIYCVIPIILHIGVPTDDLVYIIWKAIRLCSLAELNVCTELGAMHYIIYK